MRTHFTKLTFILFSFCVISVCLAPLRSRADTVTLALTTSVTGAGNFTNSFFVASNVTAQIVCIGAQGPTDFGSQLYVHFPGLPLDYVLTLPTIGNSLMTSNLPVVAGPATISLRAYSSGGLGMVFCTIQTTTSTSFNPSTAVVIPNDNGGPVTIILESSIDLISWNPALPGAYGTSTTNRFFRVRAQR
jgi:hypothetical protein